MNGKEIVLRNIGCEYINGRRSFTQLELSRKIAMSLSMVNAVVSSLKDINAVRVKQRSFEVIALDRLLLYWATHRNLKKDIIYKTRVDASVKDIERSMPDNVAFTGYSGYRLLFRESPADYSEVYAYATDGGLKEIRSRFKPNDRTPNLIILECDRDLEKAINEKGIESSSVCKAQLFADLWNLNQWYSKDFVDALSKRLGI